MTINNAKHQNVLIRILKDIFSDSRVSPYLGFKGGTAAEIFYGLDRYSVDLDFDLLDSAKEDLVFEGVKSILKSYGKVKEARKKRFNLFFILSYDGKDPHAQNVKVEINRRSFGSKYQVEPYLGISMKVMSKDDMFAHKLMAMYERLGGSNRDIFDVQFFFSHDFPINKQLLEERSGTSYKNFLKKAIKAMDKFDDKDILSNMGELLTEKQKIWAKAKLKAEVIFSLKLALEGEK
jgi:predicted nucleotidyltransferase component of viral defense system